MKWFGQSQVPRNGLSQSSTWEIWCKTFFTDLWDCDTRKGVMDVLVLMLQIHTVRTMLAFCSESYQPLSLV